VRLDFETKMKLAQTILSELAAKRPVVAKCLDCGVLSAALPRLQASPRAQSGDESPQSRRFAPSEAANGFVAQTNLSKLDEAGVAFPLTPALSLGERENLAPSHEMSRDWIRAVSSQANQNVQSLFPLPKGEGQGEGEVSKHFTGLSKSASARN